MNIKNAMHLLKTVRPILFIWYNYFSKNIIHEGNGKIVPYKNATLDIAKDARIYIGNGDIEIGTNQFKHSHRGASIRMCGNAIWKAQNGCQLFFDVILDIKKELFWKQGILL